MKINNCYVIDMHTHLRNNISYHTKLAKESDIGVVIYMANSYPVLDTKEKIIKSLKKKRAIEAFPVSAITYGLKGKKIVDIDAIKDYVVGFSDDGKCLKDLKILEDTLQKDVLVMAHCEPETRYIEKYSNVLAKVGGRLHIQHVSRKSSVNLIRDVKKNGLEITCETCPHYFTYTKKDLQTRVNPPLAEKKDIESIKEGLADGTIDVIASDYAPLPRITGIAGFRSLLPLSYGLVMQGVLTEKELWHKLSGNPAKIIGLSNFLKKLPKI
ncbi:MAG: hypothetical protein KKA79_06540 [Nanoarchaeota archaeon]|nr:hypothetical protein [Nanoarchaeota archaeon]MCG2718977.1 hypothetical protein [Nanoarchaeota archaeon]